MTQTSNPHIRTAISALLVFALLVFAPVSIASYDECEQDCNDQYAWDAFECLYELALCEGGCLLATGGVGLLVCTAACLYAAWDCEDDASETYDQCVEDCPEDDDDDDDNWIVNLVPHRFSG